MFFAAQLALLFLLSPHHAESQNISVVLLDFLRYTNGHAASCFTIGWRDPSSDPCGGWSGVRCDASGRFVSSSIFPALSRLPANATLDMGLSGNPAIRGALPAAWANPQRRVVAFSLIARAVVAIR